MIDPRGRTIMLLPALLAATIACGHRQGPAALPGAEALSVDVETLWKKEAAEDPITAYKLRLASDPDNPGLHNNLGNAYVHENQMREALDAFRAAAALDKNSPIPWNNIGIVCKKQGRPGAAKDAFEKAIRIDERYALAYYNLGTVYDEQGDYDTAIDLYLQALALKPELAQVAHNPQVVENQRIMVVQLRHFLEESGNIALPLDRLPE